MKFTLSTNLIMVVLLMMAYPVYVSAEEESEKDSSGLVSDVMADNKPADLDEISFSGFLEDYSQLKPGGNGKAAYLWLKSDAQFGNYKRFIIDQPLIYLKPGSASEGETVAINADDMKELADYLRNALIQSIDEQYEVVNEPGPGVLRVRTAITDVDPVSSGNAAVKLLLSINLDVGAAALEGELVDTSTGERLAAMVDRRVGTRVGPTGGYTRWSHTKAAFRTWASRFRNRLDEWHGIKQAKQEKQESN